MNSYRRLCDRDEVDEMLQMLDFYRRELRDSDCPLKDIFDRMLAIEQVGNLYLEPLDNDFYRTHAALLF
jgi:hypothetical protein